MSKDLTSLTSVSVFAKAKMPIDGAIRLNPSTTSGFKRMAEVCVTPVAKFTGKVYVGLV